LLLSFDEENILTTGYPNNPILAKVNASVEFVKFMEFVEFMEFMEFMEFIESL